MKTDLAPVVQTMDNAIAQRIHRYPVDKYPVYLQESDLSGE